MKYREQHIIRKTIKICFGIFTLFLLILFLVAGIKSYVDHKKLQTNLVEQNSIVNKIEGKDSEDIGQTQVSIPNEILASTGMSELEIRELVNNMFDENGNMTRDGEKVQEIIEKTIVENNEYITYEEVKDHSEEIDLLMRELAGLEHENNNLNGKIDVTEDEFSSIVDELRKNFGESLDDKHKENNSRMDWIEKFFGDKTDSMKDEFANSIDFLDGDINSKIKQLGITVNERIDTVENNFNLTINTLEKTVNSRIDNVQDKLNKDLEDNVTSLNEKIINVNDNLNKKLEDYNTSLNTRIDTVENNLNASNENFFNFKQEINGRTDDLKYALDNLSADKILYDNSRSSTSVDAQNVQEAIDKLGKSVGDGKKELANAITLRYEQAGSSPEDTLDGNSSFSELSNAIKKLPVEITIQGNSVTPKIKYYYHHHVDENGKYVCGIDDECRKCGQDVKLKASVSGGCYTKAVYHSHSSGCYSECYHPSEYLQSELTNGSNWDSRGRAWCTRCGKSYTTTTKDSANKGGYTWGEDDARDELRKKPGTYLSCSKAEAIEYYSLDCNLVEDQIIKAELDFT